MIQESQLNPLAVKGLMMRKDWAPSLGWGMLSWGSLDGALSLAEGWSVERLPWGVGLVKAIHL